MQEKLEFAKERERLRAELARDKAERAAAYVLLTYALSMGYLSLGPVLRCTCMRGKAWRSARMSLRQARGMQCSALTSPSFPRARREAFSRMLGVPNNIVDFFN